MVNHKNVFATTCSFGQVIQFLGILCCRSDENGNIVYPGDPVL